MSTITDGKGYASEGGVHFEYIRAELEQALKNSLRSGDLYTRYSTNQYLILLIGIEEENCGLVIERINDNMERTAGKKYVKYHKVLVNRTDEQIRGEIQYKQEDLSTIRKNKEKIEKYNAFYNTEQAMIGYTIHKSTGNG